MVGNRAKRTDLKNTMAAKKPTMEDVAPLDSVSTATVSRVLTGTLSATADETAVAVHQIAERLGYVVNSSGVSLRSQRSP